MEKLIRSAAPVQPQTPEEWAGEGSRSRKTSSVAVEVGSVCSLGADRIVRDFGEKWNRPAGRCSSRYAHI